MPTTQRSNAGAAGSRSAKVAALETYWRPRLEALVSNAFELEEITPTMEGIVLDYLSHEGKPVRIAFTFSHDAKIQRTACGPAGQPLLQETAGAADQAG
jgi:hypothetical protein